MDEAWARWRSGQAVKVLSRQMNRCPSTIWDYFKRCAGSRQQPRRRWELRLGLAEREEISRGLAAGLSFRVITAGLDRAPSTICREVARNGGRAGYRAQAADRLAWARASRPKPAKLARSPVLRGIVEDKLACRWSPGQIAGWLARHYPGDAEMRVSHETIYRSLFVQSRGALGQHPQSRGSQCGERV
jgi:IS30 family transposase